MTTSVSLRRTIRKIPAIRSLPGHELDAIIDRMIYKEYQPGDVILHVNAHTSFLEIVQRGEIVVEYRVNGSVVRSTRYSAGDLVRSRENGTHSRATVLARAITDARLYTFSKEQAEIFLKPNPLHSNIRPSSIPRHNLYLPWRKFWAVIVAVLIIFLTWNDTVRIVAGVLYGISDRLSQPVNDYQRSMRLLGYAEAIDQGAVFAYNREGYILYQYEDLQQAEDVFVRALDVDRANGPVLNNLAVTYHQTERIPQAVSYLRRAVQNDLDNAIVRYNLGVVLMEQNNLSEAIREFRQASYINSTWVLPYIQLGFLYLQIGDYTNAEKSALTAIQLDPAQQSANLILGIALHGQGKDTEALESLERVLQVTPGDRVASFYKALALSNLGEFDAALSILEQLRQTSSDQEQVSRITAEIVVLNYSLQNNSVGEP